MSSLAILRPGRIGGLEIPNRVVRTAHTTLLGERAQITEALIAYHERAARGGAGLHVLEVATVHRSSPGPLNLSTDRIVQGYETLMQRLRPLGVRVFQQVGHAGPQAPPNRDGDPPWAASQVQPVAGAPVPVAMTQSMIDEVVAAFAAAARRCEQGGLDGIEIHAAHGYLLHAFLSPLSNLRTDAYGGGTRERSRLLLEVMVAVRGAVSPQFPVGVRVSPDGVTGGLDSTMLSAAAVELEAGGLADFVDISLGSYVNRAGTIGGMYEPAGYQLAGSLPIAAATALPSIVTGRFTTLDEANEVVSRGQAEFVGMTRAHIADPDVVAKFRSGRSREVRPCIACNACAASIEGGTIGCAVNPTAGRETTLEPLSVTQADTRQTVVVVGGGPGGLEAARAAAVRGHRVTLLEREPRLGGQLAIARRAPFRARIGAIADWLEHECARLGVDIRCCTPATPDLVRSLGPDRVVLATGSRPRTAADTVTSWEVLAGGVAAASAVVVDETGSYEAAAAAEQLLQDGAAVTYVTPLSAFLGPLADQLEPIPALRRFRAHDFSLYTRCGVRGIEPGHVTLGYLDGGDPFTVPADITVRVTVNVSENELAKVLGDVAELVTVGDAVSPRGLRTAISEGHRAGVGAPVARDRSRASGRPAAAAA